MTACLIEGAHLHSLLAANTLAAAAACLTSCASRVPHVASTACSLMSTARPWLLMRACCSMSATEQQTNPLPEPTSMNLHKKTSIACSWTHHKRRATQATYVQTGPVHQLSLSCSSASTNAKLSCRMCGEVSPWLQGEVKHCSSNALHLRVHRHGRCSMSS